MEDFAPNNLNRGADAVPLISHSADDELSDSSMDTTNATVAEPKDEPMNFNSPKNLPQPTLVYKSNPKFPQVELCRDFRDRDQLTDVTVKVGDKEIRAHKLILAATIPYFQKMFCSGMEFVESKKDGELFCDLIKNLYFFKL